MKKNILKLSAVLLIFSVLTACSRNEFMDLSGFIYRFNRVSEEEIEFEDVYGYTDESNEVFEIFFEEDEPGVVMKLIAENGRIKQIRIAVARADINGQFISPSAETVREFTEIAESALMAYCGYNKSQTRSLLNNFGLNNAETYRKKGELTAEENGFRFIYYSDSFVCDFMINNTYLLKTEPTEKPVSKPAYGNTTNVRGETTPLPTFKR